MVSNIHHTATAHAVLARNAPLIIVARALRVLKKCRECGSIESILDLITLDSFCQKATNRSAF